MPIKFSPIARKNPRDLDATPKYYAQIIGDGKTTLSDLAKHSSTMSTVSKADILAVLESTFSKIAEDVADGKIVYVGEYFTLQASGSSVGSDKEKRRDCSQYQKCESSFPPWQNDQRRFKTGSF